MAATLHPGSNRSLFQLQQNKPSATNFYQTKGIFFQKTRTQTLRPFSHNPQEVTILAQLNVVCI
jgi:hypothetical protein